MQHAHRDIWVGHHMPVYQFTKFFFSPSPFPPISLLPLLFLPSSYLIHLSLSLLPHFSIPLSVTCSSPSHPTPLPPPPPLLYPSTHTSPSLLFPHCPPHLLPFFQQDLGLQAEDHFVLKVVQLEELIQVRHSVMVIGNAGTGE